jgi:hypothetical protein
MSLLSLLCFLALSLIQTFDQQPDLYSNVIIRLSFKPSAFRNMSE